MGHVSSGGVCALDLHWAPPAVGCFGRPVATAVLRHVPRGPCPGPLALVYLPAIEANTLPFRRRKDKNVLPFGKYIFGRYALSVMGGFREVCTEGPTQFPTVFSPRRRNSVLGGALPSFL